jgi:hypothetical protein
MLWRLSWSDKRTDGAEGHAGCLLRPEWADPGHGKRYEQLKSEDAVYTYTTRSAK